MTRKRRRGNLNIHRRRRKKRKIIANNFEADDERSGYGDPERELQLMHEYNPHLRQIHCKILVKCDQFSDNHRLLSHDCAPRSVYYTRDRRCRSTLHWGQRKLLLSEIEFLTAYAIPEYSPPSSPVTVLYCGAAPGKHIKYLAQHLFPHCKFVLVDPSVFDLCITADKEGEGRAENIEIINEYFTDTMAHRYAKEQVLFISDIRTANHRDMSFEENEQFIARDMADQMRWHRILKPRKSLLKFRLPYIPGSTEYLDGDLYLPVWGAQSTTECRLVPSDTGTRTYDNKRHWEQMFYFNTTTRVSYYEHGIQDGNSGLDHCYDCMSEIYILRQYLRNSGREHTDEAVSKMSHEISLMLSPNERRTLTGKVLRLESVSLPFLSQMHKEWRYRQAESDPS